MTSREVVAGSAVGLVASIALVVCLRETAALRASLAAVEAAREAASDSCVLREPDLQEVGLSHDYDRALVCSFTAPGRECWEIYRRRNPFTPIATTTAPGRVLTGGGVRIYEVYACRRWDAGPGGWDCPEGLAHP